MGCRPWSHDSQKPRHCAANQGKAKGGAPSWKSPWAQSWVGRCDENHGFHVTWTRGNSEGWPKKIWKPAFFPKTEPSLTLVTRVLMNFFYSEISHFRELLYFCIMDFIGVNISQLILKLIINITCCSSCRWRPPDLGLFPNSLFSFLERGVPLPLPGSGSNMRIIIKKIRKNWAKISNTKAYQV